MTKWIFLVVGIIAGIACGAHGDFPYPFYNLSMPPECYEKGILLGKEGKHGWKDRPLSTCAPDPDGSKMKCAVAYVGDFYSAQGDFMKCQSDLGACQKKCQK